MGCFGAGFLNRVFWSGGFLGDFLNIVFLVWIFLMRFFD